MSNEEDPERKKQKKMPVVAEDYIFLDGAVKSYLAAEVKAVLLPEKFSEYEGYPSLVLDGASGVGKTQQFFALVKDGKPAVYLLMARNHGERPQQVYKELRSGLGMSLLNLIIPTMEGVERANSEMNDPADDPFSVGSITDFISDQSITVLQDIIRELYDNRLQCANNELRRIGKSTKETAHNMILNELKDKVLFVDEALPRVNAGDRKDSHAKLRFIRNLARALGMRVVLAGTAATAANMLTVSNKNDTSRNGSPESGWVECEFLWRPITDFKGLFSDTEGGAGEIISKISELKLQQHWKLICDQLKNERPLLAVYFDEAIREVSNASNIAELLDLVGQKLQKNKRSNDFNEGQLIWLSGAWLRGQHVAPSPLPMEAPDLVKSHFFEPAIATRVGKSYELKPYDGLGFAEVELVPSPLRLSITKETLGNKNVIWSMAASSEPDKAIGKGSSKNAVLCDNLGGVAYALKHVVQQCLATEPILAVALSILTLSVPLKTYTDIAPATWKESKMQHTSNQVCGEVNEHICFTALQVCSQAASFPNTTDVIQFCQKFSHLAMRPDSWTNDASRATAKLWVAKENVAVVLETKLESSFFRPQPQTLKTRLEFLQAEGTMENTEFVPVAKQENEGETTDEFSERKNLRKKFEDELKMGWDSYVAESDEATKRKCETIKMPWLVPACSTEMLKKQIDAAPSLFNDMNIAGLIPGEDKQSPFDSSAYLWKNGAPREWLFEFKARQKEYGAATGVADLEKKMQSEKKKSDGTPCNAMLIAIRGEGDSEMHAWMDGDNLRVVLLVREMSSML